MSKDGGSSENMETRVAFVFSVLVQRNKQLADRKCISKILTEYVYVYAYAYVYVYVYEYVYIYIYVCVQRYGYIYAYIFPINFTFSQISMLG